jgi:hypothetical protein
VHTAELHSEARFNEQYISEYIILVEFVLLVLADSNSKVSIILIPSSCDIEQ